VDGRVKTHKDLLEEFEEIEEAERENRDRWLEDLKFGFSADQWDEKLKRMRQNDQNGARPCLTVNKIPAHARQILNDMRQARASIKVLPVDSDADVETADVIQGIIRHIEHTSNAEQAYSVASEYQVMMGVGYFRIDTVYSDPLYNEQEIRINAIRNPFSVYMDPWITDITGGDAKRCFVASYIPRKEFERKYPKAKLSDFKSGSESSWWTEKAVRVAEAWYLEDYDEEYVIVGGRPYKAKDYDPSLGKVEREAKAPKKRLQWCKINGDDILEKSEKLGQYIPIIRVAGEDIDIDGERIVHGIVRRARDAQQMYNFTVSAIAERNALEPKAPWLVAAESIDGHEEAFAMANRANLPFLTYNAMTDDGQPLPAPQRQFPTGANGALIAQLQASDGDVQATIGQFAASLGETSNEKSGAAIRQRQMVGDIATFHYPDNLGRAIRQCGRVIVDLIPQIYDTARVARILGEDGEAEQVRLDPSIQGAMQESADKKIGTIYNVGVGKYDVAVSVGPSYATKRQEAADAMSEVLQGNPQLMGVIGDLYMKTLDTPYSDEMAKRIRATIPPEIRQDDEETELPPEAIAQIQQAEQVIQEQQAQMEAMAQEAQKLQQAVDGKVIEQQMKAQEAELRVAEMQNESALKAQEYQLRMAELALKEAEITAKIREAELKLQMQAEKDVAERQESSVQTAANVETQQMFASLAQAMMAQTETVTAMLIELAKPKVMQVQYDANGNIVGGVSQTLN